MKNNHCLFTLLVNSDFGLHIIILIQGLIKVGFMILIKEYVLRLAAAKLYVQPSFLPDYTTLGKRLENSYFIAMDEAELYS